MINVKTVRIICWFLLFAVSFSLIGCVDPKQDVYALMDEFEAACNSLDFSAVLERIDPKISKKIKYATGIVGFVTNKKTDEIFESIADWIVQDYDVGADFFESIEIDVDHVVISGNKATVSAVLRFDMAGNDMEESATFICVKRSGEWYISDFTIH